MHTHHQASPTLPEILINWETHQNPVSREAFSFTAESETSFSAERYQDRQGQHEKLP